MIMYEYFHFGELNNTRFFYSDNMNFYSHFHRSYEFIYIIKGKMEIEVGKEKHILNKEDCALFLPNDIHSYRSIGETRSVLYIFSPELVNQFTQVFKGKNVTDHSFKISNETLNYMYKINKPMLEKVENDLQSPELTEDKKVKFNPVSGLFEMQTKACLYMLCSDFYKEKYEKNQIINAPTNDDLLLHNILMFIDENYKNNISLKIIANKFGYDYNYLSRYLKKKMGVSFSKYLNDYRVAAAQNLLKTTDKKIIEISEEVGFESVRSFNRVFKASMGVSPKEIRK